MFGWWRAGELGELLARDRRPVTEAERLRRTARAAVEDWREAKRREERLRVAVEDWCGVDS